MKRKEVYEAITCAIEEIVCPENFSITIRTTSMMIEIEDYKTSISYEEIQFVHVLQKTMVIETENMLVVIARSFIQCLVK